MHSGIRHLQIFDSRQSATFPAIVQYPTLTPPAGTQLGPYHFDATLAAPLAEGRFPVCLVSHGGGGSHLLYRTLCTHLAQNGFIVVCLEHLGDNRNDRSLADTDQAAEHRPRHVSLALDAVLSDAIFRAGADAARIGIIGHSMGGYTALALVGGQPWSRSRQRLSVTPDARIRAGVLLAPATDWFLAPGALAQVATPLLAMVGGRDAITPPERVQRVLSQLPPGTPLEWEVIPNAGHFSFLSPFPAPLRRPDFPPALDPAGFDREQFHRELPRRLHDFLAPALRRSHAVKT